MTRGNSSIDPIVLSGGSLKSLCAALNWRAIQTTCEIDSPPEPFTLKLPATTCKTEFPWHLEELYHDGDFNALTFDVRKSTATTVRLYLSLTITSRRNNNARVTRWIDTP